MTSQQWKVLTNSKKSIIKSRKGMKVIQMFQNRTTAIEKDSIPISPKCRLSQRSQTIQVGLQVPDIEVIIRVSGCLLRGNLLKQIYTSIPKM